ncbi:hypothetical protein CEP54_010933 [Fusarium duplospermum]|uniref:Uncharacterized protein n=1 Tax=Fusarium duplospermum TaxID=1325734 RepID=A0A428PH43_9HYPO|nr:hypothetical protein CEP54_010933 [Fusarium duplospermum]
MLWPRDSHGPCFFSVWSPTSTSTAHWTTTTRVIKQVAATPSVGSVARPRIHVDAWRLSSLVFDQRCRTAPAPRQARHPPPSAGRSYDAEQIRRALSLLTSPAPSPSHPRQSLGPRATALGLQLVPPLQGLSCQAWAKLYIARPVSPSKCLPIPPVGAMHSSNTSLETLPTIDRPRTTYRLIS